MKSIITEKEIDFFEKIAREKFEEDGMVEPPIVFLNTKDGVRPITLGRVFANYDRRLVMTSVGKMLNPTEAVFISETWFVRPKKGKKILNIRPSEHPDREEMIIIIARNKSGKKIKTRSIIIDSKTRALKKTIKNMADDMVGILDYLFDPEVARLKEYVQSKKIK